MDHIADITEYLRMLLASEHFHALLVQGPPGWGKTSLIRSSLGQLGVNYRVLGAYATPLALFNALAGDPDGLLVIDDTAALFQNQTAVSVLNSATWPGAEGTRRVVWSSTTVRVEADAFDYAGKIIVLANTLAETPQVQAFRNRSLCYNLEISRDGVGDLLVAAARDTTHFADTAKAVQVAEFLRSYGKFSGPGEISLRTLRLGYEFAVCAPERWQELLVKALPNTKPHQVALELAATDASVEEQAIEFQKKTGLSRRKFFYIREHVGLSAPKKSRPRANVVALKIASDGSGTNADQ